MKSKPNRIENVKPSWKNNWFSIIKTNQTELNKSVWFHLVSVFFPPLLPTKSKFKFTKLLTSKSLNKFSSVYHFITNTDTPPYTYHTQFEGSDLGSNFNLCTTPIENNDFQMNFERASTLMMICHAP